MKYEILKSRKIKKYNNKFHEFLIRNNHGNLFYSYYPKSNKKLIKDLLDNDEVEMIRNYIGFYKVPFEYLPTYDDMVNEKYKADDVIYDIYCEIDEEEFKELIEELLHTKPAGPVRRAC